MRGKLAILCSGQGTQHAGMFDLVAQADAAQPIFQAAREVLDGRDPRQFVREADPVALFSNRAGQILCCTQALAAWATIAPALPGMVVLAGYSVGELAAWGCAGLLPTTHVLRLAVERAAAMDEAGGDGTGLAAVIGLDEARVTALCRAHGAHVAIVNGEDFFVVGGPRETLPGLLDQARAAGATNATVLRVAIASHTPFLAGASARFGEALGRVPLPQNVPERFRLLSGVDGDPVFDVADGARKLAAQISHPLQWAACLDGCQAAGVEAVLELGPGHALANLARQALPRAAVRSLEDFRTPDGVLSWLRKG